jgi:DNA-directed RNA polymerase specialized sigma24 family protein
LFFIEDGKVERRMRLSDSYMDLCNSIDAWKARLEGYKGELKVLTRLARLDGPSDIKAVNYSEVRSGGFVQMPFLEALERIQKIKSHILLHEEAIAHLEETKRKMEEKVSQLSGIENQVVYMRDFQKKKLIEIADELGYSYDYIREISAKTRRKAAQEKKK